MWRCKQTPTSGEQRDLVTRTIPGQIRMTDGEICIPSRDVVQIVFCVGSPEAIWSVVWQRRIKGRPVNLFRCCVAFLCEGGLCVSLVSCKVQQRPLLVLAGIPSFCTNTPGHSPYVSPPLSGESEAVFPLFVVNKSRGILSKCLRQNM